MENIPEAIVEYILSFIFVKCSKCSTNYHFSEITSNYKMFEYKSVFDDDYGMDHFIVYERICNDCKWELGLFMFVSERK